MKVNIKNQLLTIGILLALSFIGVFSFALAQSSFTNGLVNFPGNTFTSTNMVRLITNLTCYFIRFGVLASIIAVFIYGIMFLKSRGNPQEFGGAKKAFAWGLVGVLVIFSVFTIILTLAAIIGVDYPILNFVRCS